MASRSIRYKSLSIRTPRFVGVGVGDDNDAAAFLQEAGIADYMQQRAIFELVSRLKGAGLWSKMKAIYPFIGGTASSHKWNLKDPQDTDAAFRLVFSGGWTHSATGALPNGTNAYANTFFVPNLHLSKTSTHMSTYLRDDVNGLHHDIGASNEGSTEIISIYGRFGGNALADSGNYLTSRISVSTANSIGLYNVSRTANNSLKLYKNGASIGSNTNTDNANIPNANVIISAADPGGTAANYQQFSPRQIAFATIGDGLTDTEASALYDIVDLYQKRLSRSV